MVRLDQQPAVAYATKFPKPTFALIRYSTLFEIIRSQLYGLQRRLLWGQVNAIYETMLEEKEFES